MRSWPYAALVLVWCGLAAAQETPQETPQETTRETTQETTKQTASPPIGETAGQYLAASIAPARPYAESVRAGRALNFDVVARNGGTHAATLSKLEIVFEDAAGGVLLSREANATGSMPVLDTIPNRTLGPGQERLFANPFPIVDADLAVARVRARLTFTIEGVGGESQIEASAALNAGQAARVVLPLHGEVLVWSGHDLLAHHRRFDFTNPMLRSFGMVSNSGRYAYDLVMVDADGARAHGDESVAANWVGFGQPVFAPADGMVVETRADQPDTGEWDPQALNADPNILFGNHVVIEHAPGQFLVLAHLKQGSLLVSVGDRVRAGQQIAAVGHSGSSLFPHLHLQAVDARDSRGEGVPSVFENFDRIAAGRVTHVRRGSIETGDHVRARR